MAQKEYHYTECGLDTVYLLNGFEIIENYDGSHIVRIHKMNELHRAIAEEIISDEKPLSGDEVKFLRHMLDLSQKSLADAMNIKNYQTVLRWENGQTPISGTNDRMLRVLVFLWLEKESSEIYDIINTLSDLDSQLVEAEKMYFEENNNKWREAVAA